MPVDLPRSALVVPVRADHHEEGELLHDRRSRAVFTNPGISLGAFATGMPAASNAATFDAAVPELPDTIAPAWPIRLPGGADRPAMNATAGFVPNARMYSAARSSALPPISPTMTTTSVSGSSLRYRTASGVGRPMIGSPPIPMHVV